MPNPRFAACLNDRRRIPLVCFLSGFRDVAGGDSVRGLWESIFVATNLSDLMPGPFARLKHLVLTDEVAKRSIAKARRAPLSRDVLITGLNPPSSGRAWQSMAGFGSRWQTFGRCSVTDCHIKLFSPRIAFISRSPKTEQPAPRIDPVKRSISVAGCSGPQRLVMSAATKPVFGAFVKKILWRLTRGAR